MKTATKIATKKLSGKRRQNMFRITYQPAVEAQIVLQPDDKLRNAITFGELKDSVLAHIDNLYASR
jgi:hypothetical protein